MHLNQEGLILNSVLYSVYLQMCSINLLFLLLFVIDFYIIFPMDFSLNLQKLLCFTDLVSFSCKFSILFHIDTKVVSVSSFQKELYLVFLLWDQDESGVCCMFLKPCPVSLCGEYLLLDYWFAFRVGVRETGPGLRTTCREGFSGHYVGEDVEGDGRVGGGIWMDTWRAWR